MTDSNGPIVGIDLGTTNSVVAAIVEGKPRVLDEDGEKIMPSVVGFNPNGQLITGVVARNQLAAFPGPDDRLDQTPDGDDGSDSAWRGDFHAA